MSNNRKYKKTTSLFAIVILLFSYFSIYSQTASSNRFKRVDYEYDLVSGKVNKVSYQKDSADQFIHQYSYDSDNRITKVETSSDNIVWDVDAKYFYYAHGPLARTEIGNDKVQGIDYAYTLQGWIKGVNSNTLDKKRDMGQDGKDTSIYNPSNPQLHANFAQDAFGYSLNYFKGDYKAINQVRWNNASNRFEAVTTGSELMQQTHDLFNGNIKSMVTAITQIDTTLSGNVNPQIPKPLGNAYKYDQLNRIKKSVSYTNIDLIGNLWQSSGQTIANMYGNTFSYDANGNILTQNRSDENGQEFEALNYKYRTLAGNLRQNRLYHVNDNISYTSLKTDDIDDQGHFANGASSSPLIDSVGQFNNYSYDNIGNLVKDKAEQISNIEWTVYGKVKKITRVSGSTRDNIIFDYDPMGNRIAKHVYDNANNWKYTTYYLRDAQGNIMVTYEHKNIPPPGGIGSPSMSFVLQEQHMYGSSRLGMNTPNKELIATSNSLSNLTHTIGKKYFEITNHLGSVTTVISDRKIPIGTGSAIAYYQSDIISSTDFAVFGSPLSARGFSSSKYNFGFGGQQKDDNISGKGNHNTALFWEYDTRLGRRWNLDQKPHPAVSYYASFTNNPIWNIDLLGDTTWNFNSKNGEFLGWTDLDKKENIGKALTITEKIAKDGTKSYDRKEDAVFAFNDLELDRDKILSGSMKLVFITEDDIDKAMDFNGVKTDEAKKHPWKYIERESRPKGDESILSGKSSGLLDHFTTSPVVQGGQLHVVLLPNSKIGIGYNDMDFGNFLWGHAGSMLGFSFMTLANAAHLNNAVNGRTDNPGKDIPLLDAAADQRAIFMGAIYPVKK